MVLFEQRLTDKFTEKFDRFEQLLTAMAKPASDQMGSSQPQIPSQETTDMNMSVPDVEETNTRPVETIPEHHPFNIGQQTGINDDTRPKPPADAINRNVTHRHVEAALGAPPIQVSGPRKQDEVTFTPNDNTPSAAWLLSQAIENQPGTVDGYTDNLPTSANLPTYDHNMEAKVNHILASTAHHLATGPGKIGLFPHRFVSRGRDRKRPGFNMLSLSEHIWGIFMIMKDCKPPNNIKPYLYKHIHDIIEDTCSFDWATAVRPWSEEVFSQVAENRIKWSDKADIQMLRMSMSWCTTAKIDPAAEAVSKINPHIDNKPSVNYEHAQRPKNFHQQSSGEIFRGGPPCDMYNSAQGCTLQSGHIIRGKRMIHVCRFCLFNSSASNQHPEIYCRNKGKFSQHHFQ